MSETGAATVLAVDDEKTVADTYAFRLQDQYEVETAYGGAEALDALAENDIDVVLLDRRMPELTGDEVLEYIRDKRYDCRVIMVTALDPGFETIDMPFDDYICKPIEREPLLMAVEQQLRIVALEQLGEYLQLLAKEEVLEGAVSSGDLADNTEYQELRERRERLEAELSAQLDVFDDLSAAFQRVDRQP